MKRNAVTSTTFSSLGYDPARELLEAEFLHGGIYRYYQVPANVWTDLLAAESKGGYFAQYIRGRFPYQRVG